MDNTEPMLHFDASLRQRARTFQQKLAADKSAILAKHSAAGRLRSGATLKAIAEAFEMNLLEFCKDTFAHTQSWRSVEGLDEKTLRSWTSKFLREVMATVPEPNYVSYGGPLKESADDAVETLVDGSKAKANVEIQNFELGVGNPSAATSPNYVVNAHTIIGGVQQGTVGSTQSNVVEISVIDVTQALQQIVTELAATGRGDVAHAIQADVETLKVQLAKPEPNRTILREAAGSVKSVIEGALGGIIGTAMTPQFNQALATVSGLM